MMRNLVRRVRVGLPISSLKLRISRIMTQGLLANPITRGVVIACGLLAVISSSVVMFPKIASLCMMYPEN